ncbi:MAG: hypothetical protein GY845_12125 [Planctomycetes bacterium]|nr:hypothetical protein [Planctomycetota bacterium]
MKMINREKFILVITVLSIVYFGTVAFSNEAAFMDAGSIIEGWKAQYGGIDRMHFRFSEKVIDIVENKEGPPKRGDLVMFRTAEVIIDKDTKRFHIKKSRKEGGLDDPLNIYVSAFDGKVTKDYWGSSPRKRGRIASGLRGYHTSSKKALDRYMLHFEIGIQQQDGMFKWMPFMDYLSDISKKVDKSIADKSIVVKKYLEMVSGEKCHVLEVLVKGKTSHKICFAHDKGMLPMKYQKFNDTGDVYKEVVVTETSKVETDTGVTWYPSKAHLIQPRHKQDDSGTLIMYGTITYELELFKFIPNIEVDESTFQFEFPVGTEVRDEVAGGVDYTVGYLNDREFFENIENISDQTTRASQSEVETDGDSHNQAEEVSINNVAKNDVQAGTNTKVNFKKILYYIFSVCLIISIVILVKCKKAGRVR